MKQIRLIIDSLYKVKFLSRFKVILDTVDGIFFGTPKVTTSAPHIQDNLEIKRYMSFVIIGLMPAVIASVYLYGLRALAMIAVSYIFGGLTEVLFAIFRKKEIEEGFLVTGLIFPLILPPTIPLWIVAVGIVFGVFFGKEVFGGTGRNIFNPALVGRIFIIIAFPVLMTAYWQKPFFGGLGGFTHYTSDAVTSATPLSIWKMEKVFTSTKDLLSGNTPGCLGETFRIGLIIGGIFLMYSKVSNWRIPISYLGSLFLFAGLGNFFIPTKIAPPVFQILSGGVLIGAFFMATDPVTSPYTLSGKWIYGILLGFLTVVIRSFSGYVEGVMFSIVLMNAFSPLIDSIILNVKYKPLKK